eukprot:550-Rhodomonas_salina.1
MLAAMCAVRWRGLTATGALEGGAVKFDVDGEAMVAELAGQVCSSVCLRAHGPVFRADTACAGWGQDQQVDHRIGGSVHSARSHASCRLKRVLFDADIDGADVADAATRWIVKWRALGCAALRPASEFRKQMRTLVLEYLQDTAGQEVYDMQVSAYRVVSGCERRATAVDVEIDTVVRSSLMSWAFATR